MATVVVDAALGYDTRMQNSTGTVPLNDKAEVGLVRAIGTGTLAASILNLVVGAGIFVLPALVVAVGGDGGQAYLVTAHVLVTTAMSAACAWEGSNVLGVAKINFLFAVNCPIETQQPPVLPMHA
jgi:hypothetical protein